MNSLLLLATVCLGFSAQLVVSPDQPLQFSYLDEPVVIAIQADTSGDATVSAAVRSPRIETPETYDLGTVSLRAHEESWLALPGMPPGEGFFTIDVTVTPVGGVPVVLQGGFARIRRSTGENALPIVAYGEEADPNTLRALRSAPVPAVRIDILGENAESHAATLRKQGFKLVPYLDARQTPDPAAAARKAAEMWCDSVLRWNVAAGTSVALIEDVASAVRATSCPAPVVAVVDDIDSFKSLIEQGLGNVVRSVCFEVRENGAWIVTSVQRIAEQAGFEQWDVYAMLPPPERGAEEQSYLTKRVFLALAEGFQGVAFHARELYDGGLTAAFSRVNALSFQLGDLDFAGTVPSERGVQNLLFKQGGDWFLAIWSTAGEKEITLEVGDAGRIKAVDQFNQEVPLPEASKGLLKVKIATAPLYITGRGGSLFDLAARPIAKRLAGELQKRAELMEVLGPEVSSAVNSVVISEGAVTQRTNFFAMLRILPELERRWHAGELPRHLAVSAISHLARLMRQLCVVEQQRGEAFLEPLQDTLARCEEYQAYYLTSSRGSDDHFERGDWLLGEVRRLMDEANDLAAAGRRIEASAVAALAEWRARGLEFAANASDRKEEDDVTVALALPDKPPAPVADAAAAGGAFISEEGTHKIVRGDTLSGIASKYKVPLKDLMAWNKLTAKSRLSIGQAIRVVPPGGAPVPNPQAIAQPAPAPLAEATPAPVAAPVPAPSVEAPAPPAPVTDGGVVHKIVKGDTLAGLSSKYGVSVDDLLKWNKLTKKSRLNIGQEIRISSEVTSTTESAVASDPPEPQAEPEPQPAPEASEGGVHTIAKGDTLAAVAKKYGVTLDDLLKWNKLTAKSRLNIGQEIRVSGDASTSAVVEPEAQPAPEARDEQPASAPGGTRKVSHVVERGETTHSIAKKYGVSESDFRKWNSIRAGAQLARGKAYVVYVPQRAAGSEKKKAEAEAPSGNAPAGQKQITHTVRRGDNPYVVSKKYGVKLEDFLKWNKLNKNAKFQVGEKYVVYVKK